MIIKIICFPSLSFTVPKKWVYAYLFRDNSKGTLLSIVCPLLTPQGIKKLIYHLAGQNMFPFYLMDIHFFFPAKKYNGNCSIYLLCLYIRFVSEQRFWQRRMNMFSVLTISLCPKSLPTYIIEFDDLSCASNTIC